MGQTFLKISKRFPGFDGNLAKWAVIGGKYLTPRQLGFALKPEGGAMRGLFLRAASSLFTPEWPEWPSRQFGFWCLIEK